jgi:glycine dehydrogenase subunit 1
MAQGYIPHTDDERAAMLAAIGVKSIEDLFADIPASVRFKGEMNVPPALVEADNINYLSELAALNQHIESRPSFLGAGAYRHFVPCAVDAIISRAEFSTAYTPYQPEASQGTLQVIFEFQSMMCALTGMDVANASLYEGASATAEAALLAASALGRDRILVSKAVHPEYREVLRSYRMQVVEVPLHEGRTDESAVADLLGPDVAAVIVQDPNFFGIIEASEPLATRVHEAGALLIVVHNDLTSTALLRRAGDWGADIAAGEAAAVGLPPSLGGPFVGFIAVKDQFTKRMPGRLVGLTSDQNGRRGFCLTLQTREQHIRREKATSNICTNQSLCALAVTVYLTALGPRGLREVAQACARRARYARDQFARTGLLEPRFAAPFYHEFVMRSKIDPAEVNAALSRAGMVGGYALSGAYPDMADTLLFCATEVLRRPDIDEAARVIAGLRTAASQPVMRNA